MFQHDAKRAKMLFNVIIENRHMAETNLSLSYRALISSTASSKTKIVDSGAVSQIARSLGFNPVVILNGLVRGGYLLPVHFDGIYYRLEPDEMGTKFLKHRSLQIVAAACDHALGKRWYYGMGSALYLNGMAQQSPSELIIFTDRRQIGEFSFQGNTFRIRKFSAKDYAMQIIGKNGLRFSSPSRTFTDYLYFHIKGGKQDYAVKFARDMLHSRPEIKGKLNKQLMGIYPPPFHLAVAYATDRARG